ncbi:hypothetical protein SELMODRAFT_402181 [Selaginella moellendorffii]|uniref:F-box domain-containing protein n=1 Tax=Selaginella moellendorffii TaxID=88036 RepID=D8QPU9_SELML|nr:hypothetical protein SELMODRAFT_402181 [Selaginella moellendorffii]
MKIPSFQRASSNNRILPLCDEDDDYEEAQRKETTPALPPPSPPSLRPGGDPSYGATGFQDPSSPMDPKLWSKLPEDCVDRILARLPLPSMFRLRSVCKRWNSFVHSEAFFSLQSEISASRSSFLLCTQGRVSCVYNFSLDGWHFVPVPRIILPIDIPPVTVVSASGGLLCYANQVAECSTLFVCNPFTKVLREMPPMRRVKAEMPSGLASPSLVAYKKSRLLMIGRVKGRSSATAKPELKPATAMTAMVEEGLKVWELSHGAGLGTWTEVNRAPVEMCREFLDALKPRTPLVCSGVGDLVCVTSHLSPKALVFDVSRGSWRWLPRDPLFPKKRNFHLLGFCFEPRLDIQP